MAVWRTGSTFSYRFHRDGTGNVISVTRNDGYSAWPDGRRLFERTEASPAVDATVGHAHRYVGRYEINAGFDATVSETDNRLFLNTHPLRPLSETEFFGENEPMRVGFKMNEANDVLGMWVNNPQGRQQYWKVA